MTKWLLKSKRKITGGLRHRHGKKVRRQRGRDFLPARVGAAKVKNMRVTGGNMKRVAFGADTANVSVDGKYQKTKILSVAGNPADSQFVRRNIITKGATIETELGKAKVTSRPGQDGTVNAVLLKK